MSSHSFSDDNAMKKRTPSDPVPQSLPKTAYRLGSHPNRLNVDLKSEHEHGDTKSQASGYSGSKKRGSAPLTAEEHKIYISQLPERLGLPNESAAHDKFWFGPPHVMQISSRGPSSIFPNHATAAERVSNDLRVEVINTLFNGIRAAKARATNDVQVEEALSSLRSLVHDLANDFVPRLEASFSTAVEKYAANLLGTRESELIIFQELEKRVIDAGWMNTSSHSDSRSSAFEKETSNDKPPSALPHGSPHAAGTVFEGHALTTETPPNSVRAGFGHLRGAQAIVRGSAESKGGGENETASQAPYEFRDGSQSVTHHKLAFEWLAKTFEKQILLRQPLSDQRDSVQAQLTSNFNHVFNTGGSDPRFSAASLILLDWDIFGFFENQKYNCGSDEAVSNALVIVGGDIDAQACTCVEYMTQTWPLTGDATLTALKQLLSSPYRRSSCQWFDRTKVSLSLKNQRLEAGIMGGATAFKEALEQLIFLAATFRTSPQPFGVHTCWPEIVVGTSSKTFANGKFRVAFSVDRCDREKAPKYGHCWHEMFRNPIVVQGFPIRKRPLSMRGLQMSLQVAASLIQATSLHRFAGRSYIKSFTAMLYPTAVDNKHVAWHFQRKGGPSEDDEEATGPFWDDWLGYGEASVPQSTDISLDHMLSATHVVGWSPEVDYYAGAPEAHYTIDKSRLPKADAGCILEKASLNLSSLLGGSLSFALGKRDRPLWLGGNSYLRRLEKMSKKYFVFWDEEAKRGWLVNGLSTTLHVLRASLIHISASEIFKDEVEFQWHSMQEATDANQPWSALEVLKSKANLNLKLYSDRSSQEERYIAEYRDIRQSTVVQTERLEKEDKRRSVRLEDQIDEVLDMLGSLVSHQIENAGHNGMRLKVKARRQLEGWDFRDLVVGNDPVYPRVANLSRLGYGWVDFIREIGAVTLFGSGFGELMKPLASAQTCDMWTSLPEDSYYLAASSYDLLNIMDVYDGDNDARSRVLAGKLLWQTASDPFEACRCGGQRGEPHTDYVQTILPKSLKSPFVRRKRFSLDRHGAVIFGQGVSAPLRWRNRGPPVSQSNTIESEDEDEAEAGESSTSRSQLWSEATEVSSQTNYDEMSRGPSGSASSQTRAVEEASSTSHEPSARDTSKKSRLRRLWPSRRKDTDD